MIKKYNQITCNTIANATKTTWDRIISTPMFNVSGEDPVAYQGVNAANLAITSFNRGYKDNRFMTKKQAENAGFSIKNGAKAIAISYLAPQTKELDGKQVKIPIMRLSYVYNAKDINGLGGTSIEVKTNDLVFNINQNMFSKSAKLASIKNGIVIMPTVDKFKNKETAMATYAALSSINAVKKHYSSDSIDVQKFKIKMSAALMCNKAGISFDPEHNLMEKDLNHTMYQTFNEAHFLKNEKGMSIMRSAAKIANYVANGREFETFDKSKNNNKEITKESKSKVGNKRAKLDARNKAKGTQSRTR